MKEQALALVADYADDSISSLREDAERYRWLRQQQEASRWPQVVDGLRRLDGDELDAAIDEAMHAERRPRMTVIAGRRQNTANGLN
ncbi:MAG: hypothetical protein HYU78_06080 [Rhodocyclales bacterium]|nr:hypothetical protein [Rhodocyclales bacterium]